MIELLLALQLSISEKWMHAALAGTIIVHSTDLSSTSWAAGKYGDRFKEANFFMRPFASDPIKLAVAKMSVAGAMNYTLFRLHKTRPKLVLSLALAQIPVFGYISYRNSRLNGN